MGRALTATALHKSIMRFWITAQIPSSQGRAAAWRRRTSVAALSEELGSHSSLEGLHLCGWVPIAVIEDMIYLGRLAPLAVQRQARWRLAHPLPMRVRSLPAKARSTEAGLPFADIFQRRLLVRHAASSHVRTIPIFCGGVSPGSLKDLDALISMNLIQLSAWLELRCLLFLNHLRYCIPLGPECDPPQLARLIIGDSPSAGKNSDRVIGVSGSSRILCEALNPKPSANCRNVTW